MEKKVTDIKPQEGEREPFVRDFCYLFPYIGADGVVLLEVVPLKPKQPIVLETTESDTKEINK